MHDKIFIELSDYKLDLNLINCVFGDHVGGVVSFVGLVRDINLGKRVHCINYYVFNSLAYSLLKDKCENLLLCDKILKICIFQRSGELLVGDINLIIGVSSFDRKTAFLTCNLLVEYVKHCVPIWKKEYYVDSSYTWINSI